MEDNTLALAQEVAALFDHTKEAGTVRDLLEASGGMTPDIEVGMARILERVNGRIMEEDPFFAYFYLQMDHSYDLHIPGPTASNFKDGSYVLYINPAQFLPLPMEQMKNAIKHEILHILLQHMRRAKTLKATYDAYVVDLAMDLVVNNYLLDLPRDAITIPYANQLFSLELKPFRTLEHYVAKLQVAYDRMKEEGKTQVVDGQAPEDKPDTDVHDEDEGGQADKPIEYAFDAHRTHDMWDDSDELSDQMVEKFTQQYIERAARGQAQEGFLGSLIHDFYRKQADLPWHHYLKKLMGTVEAGRKKTMTRRNRRQPERLDLRGTLRNHKARLVVALDSSGSITDDQFKQALGETLQILRAYQHELTIVECDKEIRRAYPLQSVRDVEPRLEGRGGTAFSPVIEFCNSRQTDLLVYFTDGEGEDYLKPAPKGYKILWVLTGEGTLSIKAPHGLVKRLEPVPFENAFEGDVDAEIQRENNTGGFSMANQEKFFEWSEEFLDRRKIVSSFKGLDDGAENPRN